MQNSRTQSQDEDRLLTPKQAGELLRVAPGTVKNYIYRGQLRSVLTPGGHHRVRESDVRALLQPSAVGSPPGTREPYLELIRSLIRVVEEMHDTFQAGHGERVADRARLLAQRLKLGRREQKRVWLAGLLHDVGKLWVDPRVLRKEGRLTRRERQLIQQHPVHGSELVGAIEGMEELALLIRHHHEREDGSGYPDGLAGADIPTEAKIVAVAETYESMCSPAVFRAAFSPQEAVAKMQAGGCTFYDERLTTDFLSLLH